ncbi:hypothetical protein FHW79_001026 [Azospirillum sp. OGB3]|nr:hypothetical protein [Azospirillum sp. OGB3]
MVDLDILQSLDGFSVQNLPEFGNGEKVVVEVFENDRQVRLADAPGFLQKRGRLTINPQKGEAFLNAALNATVHGVRLFVLDWQALRYGWTGAPPG